MCTKCQEEDAAAARGEVGNQTWFSKFVSAALDYYTKLAIRQSIQYLVALLRKLILLEYMGILIRW